MRCDTGHWDRGDKEDDNDREPFTVSLSNTLSMIMITIAFVNNNWDKLSDLSSPSTAIVHGDCYLYSKLYSQGPHCQSGDFFRHEIRFGV